MIPMCCYASQATQKVLYFDNIVDIEIENVQLVTPKQISAFDL